MNMKSFTRMLPGRLSSNGQNRRTHGRLPQIAMQSNAESLEPRLLMTADPDDQVRDAIQLGKIERSLKRNDSIDSATDVDIYRVNVSAGQRLSFDIDRHSGSQLDPFIRLFDSKGHQLAFNDNAAAPGEVRGFSSFLRYTFVSAGSFYLGVSGLGNQNYDAVTGGGDRNGRSGNYSLVVTSIKAAPEQGGIIVTPTSGLQTTEAGGTATFTVALKSAPTSNVVIPISTSDSSEGTVSVSKLTFTPSNWNRPQTVTVRGVDDTLDDGDVGYSIITGAASSSDARYQGLDAKDVQVANRDNDETPPPSGNRVLYLNFDGANISRTDLVRWAGRDWNDTVDWFDEDQNGIVVQPLLSRRSDREQIINQIITMVQIDLNPFGLTVRRHAGGAVENQGASTIFLGRSTLSNDFYHVASDIDFGNDNRTDIAFVGDEDWGSASDTAIALADVALHEAGHTFGLYHVQSGTSPESMGLRYQTPAMSWVTDTRFLDQSFNSYVEDDGFDHGFGHGPQNAFQTMRQSFAVNGGASGSNSSVKPLSREAIREILCDDNGERPHNPTVGMDTIGPRGWGSSHHHHDDADTIEIDDHDESGTLEIFVVTPGQPWTIPSGANGLHDDVLTAETSVSKQLPQFDSPKSGDSIVEQNATDDDELLTSLDRAELVHQFCSDSWSSLQESLNSMT